MIKVLHIVSSMNAGGVENVVYSYVSLMDKAAFQNDIACYTSENGVFKEKFESIGSTIYKLPSKRHFFKSVMVLYRILKYGEYNVIHVHLDDQSCFALFAAYIAKVRKRIVHTHCGSYEDDKSQFLHVIMKKCSLYFANTYFACSKTAAHSFYGKNFENVYIMKNGIDVERFRYSKIERDNIRCELQYSVDDIVIGNIARLSKEKNPFYLFELYEKVREKHPNVKLLLVGGGFLEDKLREYVISHNLQDKIKLVGAKVDAFRYYNALDLFVLPSVSEGFGLSFVEAQINGLITLASDRVPFETKVSDRIKFLELSDNQTNWLNIIDEIIVNKKYIHTNNMDSFNQIEIKSLVKNLEKEYSKRY